MDKNIEITIQYDVNANRFLLHNPDNIHIPSKVTLFHKIKQIISIVLCRSGEDISQ